MIMKNIQNNKSLFENTAKLFGNDAILIPGGSEIRNKLLNKIMTTRITAILTEFENKLLLEIGSGIGRWTKILSKKNYVVGIDISRTMILKTKKITDDEKCFFVVADASNLPFKKNSFDAVISITVLQHILKESELNNALVDILRCSREKIIIVEEMWSKKARQICALHYPIRISSTKDYIIKLSNQGFLLQCCNGLTFTPVAILLAKIFNKTSKFISFTFKSNFGVRNETTPLTKAVDFLLALSLLSDLILGKISPKKTFNPRLSLHTLITLNKLK